MALQVSIELADADVELRGLEVLPDHVCWTGRLDDESDAPAVVWKLANLDEPTRRAFDDLDPDALGAIVAAHPMPVPLLATLADACLAVDADSSTSRALREEQALAIARGDVRADPRWSRMLAAAALARGIPARAIDATVEIVIQPPADSRIARVRCLPDGTIVALQTYGPSALHFVKGDRRRVVELPSQSDVELGELHPFAMDPMLVAVAGARIDAGRDGVKTMVAVFDATGELVGRAAGSVAGWPKELSISAGGYWLHTVHRHALLEVRPEAEPKDPIDFRPPDPPRAIVEHARNRSPSDWPCAIGRWILAIDYDPASPYVAIAIVWIALDGGERRAFEWPPGLVRQLVESGGACWCTRPDGLWKLAPGEPPRCVWIGDVWGVAVDGDRAWLGVADKLEIFEIDVSGRIERWRTAISHDAQQLHRARGGAIVACGWKQLTIVDDTGRVIAAPEERRIPSFARLADGTAAASCGELVIVIATDGTLRSASLPYDGTLFGATEDRFLFAPDAHTSSRTAIDMLYAIDATGRLTSRLPFGDWLSQSPLHPILMASFDGSLYLVSAGTLLRWDARGPAIETSAILAPPSREPTQRGETRIAPDVDPIYDRLEVGIEIRRTSFFAIGGTYDGSAGQDVPVRVADGAIATFVDCELRGESGEFVTRASTVFLVRCKLPGTSTGWTIGKDCHLVLIDCEIENASG